MKKLLLWALIAMVMCSCSSSFSDDVEEVYSQVVNTEKVLRPDLSGERIELDLRGYGLYLIEQNSIFDYFMEVLPYPLLVKVSESSRLETKEIVRIICIWAVNEETGDVLAECDGYLEFKEVLAKSSYRQYCWW